MGEDGRSIMKRVEDERWKVSVNRVGSGFAVSPVRGLMECENWALVGDRDAGPVRRFLSNVWRALSGTYIRREYPKTEKALIVAKVECERWCEVENRREDEAREVLRRVEPTCP